MIEYTLVRSKRKTISIIVREGVVIVRAPLWGSQTEIDKIVTSKEKWIRGKLFASQEQSEQKELFSLDYNSEVVLRGSKYLIVLRDGTHAGFDGKHFYMPGGLGNEQIKDVCIKIYRRVAKEHLLTRVALYTKLIGVQPSSVKINGAKTRWGSCSARKSINFSWRLIMADDEVIDYVVVHELAHIIQMNHSKKFWDVVENVLPDYRERKARLHTLQKRLACEDWG